MASLIIPEGDPLVKEIKKLAEKACVEAICVLTRFTDGEETWTSVVISFRRIQGCPRESDDRPFSPTLQNLFLRIARITGKDLDVRTTPEEKGILTGGMLAFRSIHIDGRRKREETFSSGSLPWLLIHELAHFFFAPFPLDDTEETEEDTAEDNEQVEQEIHLTNTIRRELGEDCYRYPDHGLEVYICPGLPGELKAVEVDREGKVKREAPIEVGTDPNPIVPFTDNGRLAGPGTY